MHLKFQLDVISGPNRKTYKRLRVFISCATRSPDFFSPVILPARAYPHGSLPDPHLCLPNVKTFPSFPI